VEVAQEWLLVHLDRRSEVSYGLLHDQIHFRNLYLASLGNVLAAALFVADLFVEDSARNPRRIGLWIFAYPSVVLRCKASIGWVKRSKSIAQFFSRGLTLAEPALDGRKVLLEVLEIPFPQ
jgi:hypothetical protein